MKTKKDQLTIINQTKIPTKIIEALLLEAKPLSVDIAKIRFIIKPNQGKYGSSCYWQSPNRILLRIWNVTFPLLRNAYQHKTVKPVLVHCWEELFIESAAHEMTHYRQYRDNKKLSELEASLCGLAQLERYQKKLKQAACPAPTITTI